MTSVLGVSVPKVGIAKQESAAPKDAPKQGVFTPKNLALGGLAATFLVGGGVIGAMRGNPLVGLGVGGALAAATVGAALLGSASSSRRDGFCDYYGDPDCDYPYVDPYPYPHEPHYPGGYDPHYPDPGYPDPYYPGGGTSHGDDY